MSVDWAYEYQEDLYRWRGDWVKCWIDLFGYQPSRDQRRVIEALQDPGSRVAWHSGHKCGKTTTLANANIIFLVTVRNGRGIATAPSHQTLKENLWAEISKSIQRSDEFWGSIGWPAEFHLSSLLKQTHSDLRLSAIGAEHVWRLNARSPRSDQPESIAGGHQTNFELDPTGSAMELENDAMLLVTIDEGSAVTEAVYETLDGSIQGGARFIMAGNCTRTSGRFFKSQQSENRQIYSFFRSRSSDQPWYKPEYGARLEALAGKDSNLYRVRILGLPPKQEQDALVPFEDIEAARFREPYQGKDEPLVMSIDVAQLGGDRTMILFRKGKNILDLITLPADKLDQTREKIKQHIKARKPNIITIDNVGLGADMADTLEGLGHPIVRVDSRAAAKIENHEPETLMGYKFENTRCFVHFLLQQWFADKKPSLALPWIQDPERRKAAQETLTAELSILKFDASDGFFRVPDKRSMKKELRKLGTGVQSTDATDALANSFGIRGPVSDDEYTVAGVPLSDEQIYVDGHFHIPAEGEPFAMGGLF